MRETAFQSLLSSRKKDLKMYSCSLEVIINSIDYPPKINNINGFFLNLQGIEKFLQEFYDEVEGNNVPARIADSDTRSQKSKLTAGRKSEISSVAGS